MAHDSIDMGSVAPGGTDLLKEVDWHIRPKDRIGLGDESTGKTRYCVLFWVSNTLIMDGLQNGMD